MSSSGIFMNEGSLVVEFAPVELLLLEKPEADLIQGMFSVIRVGIGLPALLKHSCPVKDMICRTLPLWLCFAFGWSRPSETA